VAFGTSAPELVVSVVGAVQGASGLVFGNIIGSNIANIGLVLGAAVLVRPILIQGQVVVRELPLLLLATGILLALAVDGGDDAIGRQDAIVLLMLFGAFIYIVAADVIRVRQQDALVAGVIGGIQALGVTAPRPGVPRSEWLLLVGGLAGLVIGGQLTVSSGLELATTLGLDSAIVGALIVAVGTSLPELATSVIAGYKNEPDIALGNIVGSNLFNSLLILPVAALIDPVAIPSGGMFDLCMSLALGVGLVPVLLSRRARMGRLSGALLLAAWCVYAALRLT
jgi:cation:H+ antiporter